jgi:YihY family inner membrane protein
MVADRIRNVPAASGASRRRRLGREILRLWTVICRAVNKFLLIDGLDRAGAFAFNAFFALFPLMILLFTAASFFVDRDKACKAVISYMESYIPASVGLQHHVIETLTGVIKERKQAGGVAFLMLIWVALQCFSTLVSATTRAWGATVYNWWQLPLKSLMLLGTTAGAVLVGMAVPALMRISKSWLFTSPYFRSWTYGIESFLIPLAAVFFGLSMFYRLAPRRPTRFADVWIVALCATVLLRAGESLFIIYLKDFARLNAVYGAFGGIMGLLLWIYVSGCVFIFGACLCASHAELRSAHATA